MTPEQWSAHVAIQWSMLIAQMMQGGQSIASARLSAAGIVRSGIVLGGDATLVPDWLRVEADAC